ncbi:MAG: hypothetical protein KTR25_02510 [Myxococcales bacterium]|nr:hypothetical protein [Myxococcales bacterium]
MSSRRRLWIATVFVVVEVLLIWGTSYAVITYAPHFSWLIAVATLPLFALLPLTHPSPERRELELRLDRKRHILDKTAFAEEQKVFEAIRQQMLKDVKQREAQLLHRHRELEHRAKLSYEWTEFPTKLKDTVLSPSVDQELELNERINELIREEAKECFTRFQNGDYTSKDNSVRRTLNQDLLHLVEKVARIYHSDSERPLLETSPHQLLRAMNRIALQLLVTLDQLPIDIKSYNLKDTHEYLQRGAKAYGLYKSAAEYWSYVRPGYYLGRIALGAHPFTLVISWISGEIVKVGAKNISQKMSKYYAFWIIHQLVEIVVVQTASVFDPNYRHRDAAWYFGVELTELIYQFPNNARTWPAALKELGALQLQSEYDRIYLYRSLSEKKSAVSKTSHTNVNTQLSPSELTMVYTRLQRFAEKYIYGPEPEAFDKWLADTADRLGQPPPPPSQKQKRNLSAVPPAEAALVALNPELRSQLEAWLQEDETMQAAYPRTLIIFPDGRKRSSVVPRKHKLLLTSTQTRLLLFHFHPQTHVTDLLWTSATIGDQDAKWNIHKRKQRWGPAVCIITGGHWHHQEHQEWALSISGVRKWTFEDYFAPILDKVRAA